MGTNQSCSECDSPKSDFTKRGKQLWYKTRSGFLCGLCWNKARYLLVWFWNLCEQGPLPTNPKLCGFKVADRNRLQIGPLNPMYGRRGEKSSGWKGGITRLSLAIRGSSQYGIWRDSIFRRDNWTCQKCGKRGGKLIAHHLKRFSEILAQNKLRTLEEAFRCDELWDINNGKTLCKDCHKPTVYNKELTV